MSHRCASSSGCLQPNTCERIGRCAWSDGTTATVRVECSNGRVLSLDVDVHDLPRTVTIDGDFITVTSTTGTSCSRMVPNKKRYDFRSRTMTVESRVFARDYQGDDMRSFYQGKNVQFQRNRRR
jgi:hypothetical protein